jgi:hypothetical protein
LAIVASFQRIYAIALDTQGNKYVSDGGYIRKIDTNGIITKIAGNGSIGFSGDGGLATNASIDNAYAIAVDNVGNVYFADTFNQRIRRVDTNGIISTIAGTGDSYFGEDNIPAITTTMLEPYGLAADSAGNVYFSDVLDCRVRKINDAGIITTVVGHLGVLGVDGGGVCYFAGDGGNATNASLNYPGDIVMSSNGSRLYILETFGNRIRKVIFQ